MKKKRKNKGKKHHSLKHYEWATPGYNAPTAPKSTAGGKYPNHQKFKIQKSKRLIPFRHSSVGRAPAL